MGRDPAGPIIFVCTYVVGRFFFFSSRRRHTRFKCDWSSDVCSSDLFCLRSEEHTSDLKQKRSEEHTSELQSHLNLVCRLLLEKKMQHTIAPQPKDETVIVSDRLRQR